MFKTMIYSIGITVLISGDINAQSSNKKDVDSEVSYSTDNGFSSSSSSSYSFSNKRGRPSSALHTLQAFYNKKDYKSREQFQNKLLRIAMKYSLISEKDKQASFSISNQKVVINDMELKPKLAKLFQEELIKTVEHGDSYQYNFTTTIESRN